jgi:hypothetical protein
MAEEWAAYLKRMGAGESKFCTGSAKPPRGHQKRARLQFRKMLKAHRKLSLGLE